MHLLATLLACVAVPDTGPAATVGVPWTPRLPDLGDVATGLVPAPEGRWARAIIHLHSPYSHDACDGEGIVDGAPDATCAGHLRQALCDLRVEVALLTDHPAHGAEQDWELAFLPRAGDVAGPDWLSFPCDDADAVLVGVGSEASLMSVALERWPEPEPEANRATLEASDGSFFQAVAEEGGLAFVNHTEGHPVAALESFQDLGAVGIEVFNVHAMVDPDIRAEALGLDPTSWLLEVAPFTDPAGTAEPDLMFMAVVEPQAPSLGALDHLARRGPVTAVAGSDAHENVLPLLLRDGERVDSYRRMLRWVDNWVALPPGPADLGDVRAALRAGRSTVVFEVFGTPDDVSFWLEAGGQRVEAGGRGAEGVLHVGCPQLSPASPSNGMAPEITTTVLRDGQPFAHGCGEHPTGGSGVYRVEHTLVPHHLRDWLGEEPDALLRPLPWALTNPITVP